jgi:uncharacterized protein (DUF1015 family)
MAKIKPFKGIRPPKDLIEKVACLPYDVMNSDEAREMAAGNPYSLLHITRPEIDFPKGVDEHSEEVYAKSLSNFKDFLAKGVLKQDEKEMYYIYAQTMDGITQYGLVAGASTDDYLNGIIKKHELTRPDKEEDRMVNIRINNANIEPVFFAYPNVPDIDAIIREVVEKKDPEYDFTAEDGFGHHFWVIDDEKMIQQLTDLFATKVPYTYVADGHHRTAAAALVGAEARDKNPNHTGNEEYNYFLVVHFPDDQLRIIDYNRVVKDLNGHSKEAFLTKIKESFVVENMGKEIYKPGCLHEMSMYLDGEWYKMVAKEGTYDDDDPIGVLDVTILTNSILQPLLDIQDLRRSKRIDFVGGIRGLGELSRRVDNGDNEVAFAL